MSFPVGVKGIFADDEVATDIVEQETDAAREWILENTPDEPERSARTLGTVETTEAPQGERSIFDDIDDPEEETPQRGRDATERLHADGPSKQVGRRPWAVRDTFAPSRALGSLRPRAPSQAGVLRPRTDGDWPTRHARASAAAGAAAALRGPRLHRDRRRARRLPIPGQITAAQRSP